MLGSVIPWSHLKLLWVPPFFQNNRFYAEPIGCSVDFLIQSKFARRDSTFTGLLSYHDIFLAAFSFIYYSAAPKVYILLQSSFSLSKATRHLPQQRYNRSHSQPNFDKDFKCNTPSSAEVKLLAHLYDHSIIWY